MRQYFGKYRGKVENNLDPLQLGRVQVSVPAVLDEGTLSWAMPCMPYGGDGVGFYSVPPVGANIWVEFEGGDTDYPIWAGCYWGTGETPIDSPTDALYKRILKTDAISLTIDDTPSAGGVTLEVDSPAVNMPLKMVFDSNGILIDASPVIITMKVQDGDLQVEATTSTHTIEDTLLFDCDKSTTQLSAADGIEIIFDKAEAKLTSSGIALKNESIETNLTADSIEMKNSPSEATLGSSDFTLKHGGSEVKLSSSNIELSSSSASVKIDPSGTEVANGGAKVALSPASVSINDGALEVI